MENFIFCEVMGRAVALDLILLMNKSFLNYYGGVTVTRVTRKQILVIRLAVFHYIAMK